MSRLNLTLDSDTAEKLSRHAETLKRPLAALAKELLREGLERRERGLFRQRLAEAYVADRRDATGLVRELEAAQFDILGDEDDA